MNIVRGVADLLRKAPPPAAPAGDEPATSFPAADLEDAPTPRVVFRYARVDDRTRSLAFALRYMIPDARRARARALGFGLGAANRSAP